MSATKAVRVLGPAVPLLGERARGRDLAARPLGTAASRRSRRRPPSCSRGSPSGSRPRI
ncbi:hypothetical protein [Streptomyces sp. HM190]|uniref:hypothetical protein n=1 Tax=Streptomyces sp. HM190 TaxID=2695266 RepID=UPI00135A57F9|nr:hypothetical protein [Streptomyces sp. HM190]